MKRCRSFNGPTVYPIFSSIIALRPYSYEFQDSISRFNTDVSTFNPTVQALPRQSLSILDPVVLYRLQDRLVHLLDVSVIPISQLLDEGLSVENGRSSPVGIFKVCSRV